MGPPGWFRMSASNIRWAFFVKSCHQQNEFRCGRWTMDSKSGYSPGKVFYHGNIFILYFIFNLQPPTHFIPLRRLKSALCGLRYSTHDPTEVPVASEEWKLATRRLRRYRSIERSNVPNNSNNQSMIRRQNSNPMVLNNRRIVARYERRFSSKEFCIFIEFKWYRKRYHTVDNEQNQRVLEQLFLDR